LLKPVHQIHTSLANQNKKKLREKKVKPTPCLLPLYQQANIKHIENPTIKNLVATKGVTHNQ